MEGEEHTEGQEFPLSTAYGPRDATELDRRNGDPPLRPSKRGTYPWLRVHSPELRGWVTSRRSGAGWAGRRSRCAAILGWSPGPIRLPRWNEFRLTGDLEVSSERNDTEGLLARTLLALIGYIGQHRSDGLGIRYVGTAIALAKRCKDSSRHAVTGLFNAVENRILKRRGDKNQVYEAANLTIDAARHDLRTDDDVRAEAKALICGRSWVLQRVGRLAEAVVEARKEPRTWPEDWLG